MLFISHRGDSRLAPENTLLAFEDAVEHGADGIETDVRISADGQAILFHDRCLPDGRPVATLSRAALSDAAARAVPTLEEALGEFPDLFWMIELKTPDSIEMVLEVLHRFGASRRLIVISFWHDVIERVRRQTKLDCGITIAHRPQHPFGPRLPVWSGRTSLSAVVWNFERIDPEVLQSTRQLRLRNFVYDLANDADVQRCRDLPVDGVIVDHLPAVRDAANPPQSAAPEALLSA